MASSSTTTAVTKSTESPYQLDLDQTLKASKALIGHVQAEAQKLQSGSTKRNLLASQNSDDEDDAQDDSQPIWLGFSTKQHIVDKARLKPGKIPLPHSLNTSDDLNICVITTDPQRAVKNVVADPTFPTALSSRINRIIGVTKLQARYKSFESRRQLLAEHDVFLADDRIITRLPNLLGKVFYKGTTKRPIPISIAPRKTEDSQPQKKRVPKEEKQASVAGPAVVAAEIERALTSAVVAVRPGTNVSVRIGRASFTPAQIADNVAAVVPKVIEKHVAKGWRNIRSITIKSPTSFAVPIWLSHDLWAEEKNVAETHDQEPENIEDTEKRKKRKRNPTTTKGPQTGPSKKSKVASKEDGTRKQRLAVQKAKAFAA